jgi:hypothetical protein
LTATAKAPYVASRAMTEIDTRAVDNASATAINNHGVEIDHGR